MKEKISNRVKDFLTLERYLAIVGSILVVSGLVLFVYYTIFNIPMMFVTVTSSPLFYLIFGFSLIVFRFFIIVTSKEGECE